MNEGEILQIMSENSEANSIGLGHLTFHLIPISSINRILEAQIMTDMKKLIMILMLALPVVAFAQKPTKATKTVRSEVAEAAIPNYYGEILVLNQQGRQIIRVIFDNNTARLIQDKELRVELDNLKKMQWDSVLHAVNTLSALGWQVGDSFETESRTGNEMHLLIYKGVPKLMAPSIEPSKEGANKSGARK